MSKGLLGATSRKCLASRTPDLPANNIFIFKCVMAMKETLKHIGIWISNTSQKIFHWDFIT
jgi:hypothetical protein